jgi:hypothetical protein
MRRDPCFAPLQTAVAAGPAIKPGQDADLGMRVRLVHGDEVKHAKP